jgi:outer membrane protein assembly factor BamD (BamD/ComL family)
MMKNTKNKILLLLTISSYNFTKRPDKIDKNSLKNYKHFKMMSYEELKVKRDELLAQNKKFPAINYVERMLDQTKDLNEIRELRIMLADLYFETEDYPKAQKKFAEFKTFYPNHPKTEHASYKEIESAWLLSTSPDRDQTKSHEIIDLANEFLKNVNYVEKREAVKQIKKEAQVKILCQEINTIEFYLKDKNTKAVAKRIEFIKDKFKELIDEKILVIEPIQEYHDAVASGDKTRISKARNDLHTCYSGTCSLMHDPKLANKAANTDRSLKPRKAIHYFYVP